jgi:hypothetical protein
MILILWMSVYHYTFDGYWCWEIDEYSSEAGLNETICSSLVQGAVALTVLPVISKSERIRDIDKLFMAWSL